ARAIRKRDIGEGQPREVDQPEQQQQEQGYDDRELDQRLAARAPLALAAHSTTMEDWPCTAICGNCMPYMPVGTPGRMATLPEAVTVICAPLRSFAVRASSIFVYVLPLGPRTLTLKVQLVPLQLWVPV